MSPRSFAAAMGRFSRSTHPTRLQRRRRRGRPLPRRAGLRAERLESRAMLTTVATLSTDLSPYTRIPVTFRRPDGSVGFSNTAFVGQLGWSGMSGAAAAAGVPASFKSFCIDGLQFVSAGRATTFPTFSPAIAAAPLGGAPAIGVSRASLLESFWRQYGPASAAGFADNTDAAAFQLAVWEIINDATATGTRLTADLTSGQFSVGTAGRTLPAYQRAQQWLAGFDAAAPARSSVVLYALQSPTSQDQIVAVPTVDLDVDSDNTGAISRSAGEEGLEEQSGRPGVLVPVGGDRVPMVVEVPSGQAATLEIIKGADRVAVWTAAANGQRILSHQAPSNVITASTTLWIEGLTPSIGMADVAFRLSMPGGPGLAASSDTVHATTVAVDLSIDNLAMQIEDEGGAVIWKNSDFSRQLAAPMAFQSEPGLTRYLPDVMNTNAIDPEYRTQFTPARATITAGMAAGYTFRFSLQDSPPVTLWTRTPWEGFVPADGGWWRIPAGKLVSPKSLADTTLDFWIEGLSTTGYAQGSMGFHAVAKSGPLAGPSLADTARYTVIDVGLGVDGNRDGAINFSDSHDRQLTFWLNEDRDVLTDPGLAGAVLYDRLGMPYETDDDAYSTTDAVDERIATRRDLEDLAALHLVVDPVFQGTSTPFLRSLDRQQAPPHDRPLVRFDLTLGNPGTNLRLFRAAGDSATAHVDNSEIASLQRSNPRFAYNAEDSVTTGLSRGESAIVGNMVMYSQFDSESRSQRPQFLFEAFGQPAKTTLSFTVTVTYPRSSDSAEVRSTSRTHTVDLDLRSITSFYSRTRVPYQEPDGTDERFFVVSPDGVMPHLPDASSTHTTATTAQSPFLGGPETVVLVHGWNMTDGTQASGPRTDSKKAFAETSFKRLYWQGFRGSFISFEWPTFSGVDSYSASEYQAYRSGRALMHFLESRQAAGPTHLLAHSMGNVVAAEALRQWATDGRAGHLVANYVAMQGAISAGAYADDAQDGTDEPSSTDLYRHLPKGVSIDGSGESRYLMQDTGEAAGKWINLYNPEDYATSVLWRANNTRKPIPGPLWRNGVPHESSESRISYMVDDDGRFLRGWGSIIDKVFENATDLTLGLLDTRDSSSLGPTAYETIAFISQANAQPIGTKAVDFFDINLAISSLGLTSDYAGQLSGHSFQFQFDAATTSSFWRKVVAETAMDSVRQPRAH